MPRALVLGGYGLIGSACMGALADAGYQVTGIGRSASATRGGDPRTTWAVRDLAQMTASDWDSLLQDVSVVVNAAGALQDGGRDDLTAIHVTAVSALATAARNHDLRLVQISAAGATPEAATTFLRSKAQGDAILARAAPNWVILRPVLVLARDAYGGSALLRAAAALPGILPQVLPHARIQTVHIDDLTAAVVAAARGDIPHGTIADLTEPGIQTLPDLTLAIRRWLGLSDPAVRLPVPVWLLRGIGRVADALGPLGWRSPLRSNALRTLADGVQGDPAAWTAAGGHPCRPLAETLARHPATRADRLAARSFLAMPLAIAVLSLFWTASGLIALAAPGAAGAILTSRGAPENLAWLLVLGGAVADIALGLLILWRPWARRAALGMAGLSLAYVAGSLAAAPDLWADPLGPMLKVLPGAVLALWVWLFLEDR